MYLRYVIKQFQSTATVVFDGYHGPPSTKSMEQNRRSSRTSTVDIMFTGSMHTTTTQAEFLGNGTSNYRLITTISSILDQAGPTVEQATSDIDRHNDCVYSPGTGR